MIFWEMNDITLRFNFKDGESMVSGNIRRFYPDTRHQLRSRMAVDLSSSLPFPMPWIDIPDDIFKVPPSLRSIT